MATPNEHMEVKGVMSKRCRCCSEWLPLIAYCKDKNYADGLNIYCRECLRKMRKCEVMLLSRHDTMNNKERKAISIRKQILDREIMERREDLFLCPACGEGYGFRPLRCKKCNCTVLERLGNENTNVSIPIIAVDVREGQERVLPALSCRS